MKTARARRAVFVCADLSRVAAAFLYGIRGLMDDFSYEIIYK